jgi:hypothetical protein
MTITNGEEVLKTLFSNVRAKNVVVLINFIWVVRQVSPLCSDGVSKNIFKVLIYSIDYYTIVLYFENYGAC